MSEGRWVWFSQEEADGTTTSWREWVEGTDYIDWPEKTEGDNGRTVKAWCKALDKIRKDMLK